MYNRFQIYEGKMRNVWHVVDSFAFTPISIITMRTIYIYIYKRNIYIYMCNRITISFVLPIFSPSRSFCSLRYTFYLRARARVQKIPIYFISLVDQQYHACAIISRHGCFVRLRSINGGKNASNCRNNR